MQPIFFWVMVTSFIILFTIQVWTQMKLEKRRSDVAAVVVDDEGHPVGPTKISAHAHPRYVSKWEYLNSAFHARRQLYEDTEMPPSPASAGANAGGPVRSDQTK